jgi:hypothetical protein
MWLFTLVWATMTVGTTGLTFYQPTVIANLGFTLVAVRVAQSVSSLTVLQFNREEPALEHPNIRFVHHNHCYLRLLRRQRMATSAYHSPRVLDLHTGLLQCAVHLSQQWRRLCSHGHCQLLGSVLVPYDVALASADHVSSHRVRFCYRLRQFLWPDWGCARASDFPVQVRAPLYDIVRGRHGRPWRMHPCDLVYLVDNERDGEANQADQEAPDSGSETWRDGTRRRGCEC